ncbi:DUF3343 domain-containing protein [Clostridium sp. D2Q-11]|uniref:DUF3343 domain-containing protein n=1 Tax=Anaeromonas frigoriresistens TaxID=2683708 RepID=A0A942US58_9FIRM|nr:DUF3343 domain-containing protein [Anaeromonas frigoriresistens]MBS4538173.1 DUF3343 domain-containing protein [Anaeromonas frigoriresistens]
MNSNTYILFPSHSDGLALEKKLKEESIKYTISPTPRSLSECCGISIMISPEICHTVESIIKENRDIRISGIHTIERKSRDWFK